MAYLKCIVEGCPGRTNSDIRMFKFPGNEEMLVKRCSNIGIAKSALIVTSRICSRHFDTTCIGNKLLKDGAIPTQFEERSKQPSIFGDEPDLLFKRAQGRNSLFSSNDFAAANAAAAEIQTATAKINLEPSLNDCESGYVPTVGRWGAEWPSWLAEASLVQHGVVNDAIPHGLSAGSVRVGLTTTTDPDQDKPKSHRIVVVRPHGQSNNKETHGKHHVDNTGNSSGNNETTDDDDYDDDDYDDHQYRNHAIDIVGKNSPEGATAVLAATLATIAESDILGAAATPTTTTTTACKQDNVTSNASSERCSGIRKLLEEQHRKRMPHQRQLFGDSDEEPLLSEWWTDTDSYNLTAFNQINGIWPLGHPLPLPDWAPNDEHNKGVLHFDSVWQYEDLNAIIETKLHRLLEETHYDTLHLFVDFHKAFKRTRRSDLKSFFQFYDIPINRRHHMCVSLAKEIMARIVVLFPILEHYLYIVSCQEEVVSLSDYIDASEEVGGLNSPDANVEKEHAMVAMKISIAGREGVMILDPGYHVGRAVTVMGDQMYPHTGWFTQSKEPQIQRDYCYNYSMHSNKYVEWMEREIRGDQPTYKSSLVYVTQPYVTAIDVTVRRNLVYNFRSLLSRDAKGRVFAGIYLPVVANCNEAHFTLFYDGPSDQRVKVKFMFNVFKNPNKIPEHVQQHLQKLAPQLNMSQCDLNDLCKSIAEVVTDQDFITQVLAINDDIGNMSSEN